MRSALSAAFITVLTILPPSSFAVAQTGAVRPQPDMGQQLSRLPFRVGDTMGFQAVQVLNDTVTFAAADAPPHDRRAATIVLSLAPQLQELRNLPQTRRDQALRQLALDVPDLRDATIESLGSAQSGDNLRYDVVIRAKAAGSDLDVVRMTSLVFLPNGVVRMVATAPAAQKDAELPRFRTFVRSIDLRP
ncbi:hypothetical protein [Microvirga rosea]|uniref:hypothetical protein n=1 Tax=Microvirga rosea TaxID=2715425 RepID=UPI001D0B13DC|nr:hypothetical protein [Microvirga rosea]MCB8821867.1 hypothetical protein [Microvirga rosea]